MGSSDSEGSDSGSDSDQVQVTWSIGGPRIADQLHRICSLVVFACSLSKGD